MRSNKDWEKRTKFLYIKEYTPRIQKDLLEITKPKNLPKRIENMYLWGKSEYGKTLLACFMMLEEQKVIYMRGGPVDRYDRCTFITLTDLINKIKFTFDNKNTKQVEQEILDFYQNIHLLVLDDFGTEKPTDWLMHILYTILNYRYEYLKKTIITSNLNLSELAELLEDTRLISRIERSYKIIEKTNWKTKK